MKLISRKILATTALLCAMTLVSTQPAAARGGSVSQQDKVKSCNDLANKKGLNGDDRKNFLQDCVNKTTNAQPVKDASQRDKMDACKNLADRRNLKGEDRRSFIKDCMNKANSR